MSKPFIVLGDKTSHGGKVISACPTATTHGKPIARMGDKVTCPKCGSNTIATGDNTEIIMGKPVARHGDKTACGATLISSQSVTVITSGGSSSGDSLRTTAGIPATPDAAIAPKHSADKAESSTDKSDSGLVCTASIETNDFGDTLPVIPQKSRVSDGKVLFRVTIKARLKTKEDGKPAANHSLTIQSSQSADNIKTKGTTGSNGEMLITLETREQGTRSLTTTTSGIQMESLDVSINEAWYESPFLITGYNVCDEDDFSGKLVEGSGLSEKHKEDFLYSARGIPMQGTGKATNGKYIRLAGFKTHWHHNERGNPDHVADRSKVSFEYASGPIGSSGRVVKKNHSIATDTDVIPSGAHVDIDNIGDRYADDTGSQIIDYHIDNFLGAGQDVVDAWLKSGLSRSKQRVKFCGY